MAALERLDEVPVVPAEQRARTWENPSAFDDVRRVLQQRLGLTERQALAVCLKDMHGLSVEERNEIHLAIEKGRRARLAPDSELSDAYLDAFIPPNQRHLY